MEGVEDILLEEYAAFSMTPVEIYQPLRDGMRAGYRVELQSD